MARPRTPSIKGPVIWGSVLIATCVALAALWNVVIVTDYLHMKQLAAPGVPLGWGRWAVLAVGSTLFLGVVVGLILFLVSWVRQIRLNRAQQNFIDSVTHELKTPLTSLKLHLQTLQRGKVPQERHGEFHAIMLEDVERLANLLDHVLAAARLERRQAVQLEAVPLHPLLDEVRETIRARYQLEPEAIAVVGPPVVAHSEPSALHMVFLNLMDNAVKYSQDEIQVTVETTEDSGGQIAVRVRDRGIGVPPRHAKRIFQRFYRIGNEMTRRRTGTGLGLFIVRETLTALGGRIALEAAAPGEGSTFRVNLPGVPDV